MKKLKMIAVVAIASFMAIPVVSALSITKYGEVKDITGTHGAGMEEYGQAIEAKSTEGNGLIYNQIVTFDIEGKNMKVIDYKKGGIERPEKDDDSTWFGIAVADPTTEGSVDNACWIRDGQAQCEKDKDAEKDGPDGTRTLWIPFTADEIRTAIENTGEHAVVSKTVRIEWGGQNDHVGGQQINVVLHTDSVTLTPDDVDVEKTAGFTEEDRKAAIAVFEAKQSQDTPNADKTSNEQPAEKNADTSDINLGLLLSILSISTIGLGYTLKKRFN